MNSINKTASQSCQSCPRCGGIGHFSQWSHINEGRCFRCNGSGVDPSAPAPKARRPRKTVRKARDGQFTLESPDNPLEYAVFTLKGNSCEILWHHRGTLVYEESMDRHEGRARYRAMLAYGWGK